MVGFFCLAGVLVCNMFERHDMQQQIERLKATKPIPPAPEVPDAD